MVAVLNERSVSHGGNLCPLWLRFLSHFDIVSETPYIAAIQLAVSCSPLYFVRCFALKRTGKYAS